MKNKTKLITIIAVLAISSLLSFGDTILSSSDFIIAICSNSPASYSDYPSGEPPSKILDGDANTKYLNFGGGPWDALYCGFIVTPAGGSSTIKSFTLTTANDETSRDPAEWVLYGTDDAIVSTDNSMGLAENWTQIDSGTVSLPIARNTVGPVVQVNNSTAYTSYKMVFTVLRSGDDIMQVADAAFYSTTDGSGANILSATDAILAIQTSPTSSRYGGGEGSANLIDGDANSKYLNFAKLNTGFIVTPDMGSSIIKAFEIWTANDVEGRDPTNWVLYGTTDSITSTDNSLGTNENWTLIDEDYIALPEDRGTNSGMILVDNSIPYTSYKMIFPKVKNENGFLVDSMQIAEIQFISIPEPVTLLLLSLCLGGFAIMRKK